MSSEPTCAKNPKGVFQLACLPLHRMAAPQKGGGGLPLAPAVVSIQRRQGDSDHPPKPLAGGHGLLPEGQGQTMMASDTNTVSKFGPEQSAVEGISGTQTSLPQMKNHKGAWLCPELLMEENHFS